MSVIGSKWWAYCIGGSLCPEDSESYGWTITVDKYGGNNIWHFMKDSYYLIESSADQPECKLARLPSIYLRLKIKDMDFIALKGVLTANISRW